MDCDNKSPISQQCDASNQKTFLLQHPQDLLEGLVDQNNEKLASSQTIKNRHHEEVKQVQLMNQRMREAQILANTELFRLQAQRKEKNKANEEALRCKTKYQVYQRKLKLQIARALKDKKDYEKTKNEKKECHRQKRSEEEARIHEMEEEINEINNQICLEKQRTETLEDKRKEQLIDDMNREKRNAENYYETLRRNERIDLVKDDIIKFRDSIRDLKLRTTAFQRKVEINDLTGKEIAKKIAEQKEESEQYREQRKILIEDHEETRRKYQFAKEFYKVEKAENETLRENVSERKVRNSNIFNKSDRLWKKLQDAHEQIREMEAKQKICRDCDHALVAGTSSSSSCRIEEPISPCKWTKNIAKSQCCTIQN